MNRSALDRAALRLQESPSILARFKRKPAEALAQYRLRADEIVSLQGGDMHELVSKGLSPEIPFVRPLSRPLFASILTRAAARLASAAFAALVFALWPSSGVKADGNSAALRLRFLSQNPRISRRRALMRFGARRRASARALRRLTRLRARRIGRRRAVTRVSGGGYCIPPFCPVD